MAFNQIVKTLQKLNKHGSCIIRNKELLVLHNNNVKFFNDREHMGGEYLSKLKNNKVHIMTEAQLEELHINQYNNISEFEDYMIDLENQWKTNKTDINRFWYGMS